MCKNTLTKALGGLKHLLRYKKTVHALLIRTYTHTQHHFIHEPPRVRLSLAPSFCK